MKTNKSNLFIHVAQIVIWIWVLFSPAITNAAMAGGGFTKMAIMGNLRFMGPLCLLYFLNFYLLAPKCLFGGHKSIFYVANIVWIVVREWLRFRQFTRIPQMPRIPNPAMHAPEFHFNAMLLRPLLTGFFIQILIIGAAVALCHIIMTNRRQRELEEREKKATEAELSWLKNQLNPHFLFNTLNNISSLTQIDAEKAQESIGQLSDLLRYALYDSDQSLVPLIKDVGFMENYIDLMKLRCNNLATVETSFELPAGDVEVAPLLFISLIENAFKHGVNARKPSFVKLSLKPAGNDLVFSCENSLFDKQKEDRVGSGIGLENMLRRLELIYGRDGYEYTAIEDHDTYKSSVTLKSIVK
ncbi:MAG: histidine kinase [Bacteroidia bacterium]|nr:histidine kinase [Bacteroidia bacterium]